MSNDILNYEGGYQFGLLEVDTVRNADQPVKPGRIAPWVIQLRVLVKKYLKGCKVYCSNHGASFNEVKIQPSYEPHIFIWRSGKEDYIRVVSGSDMKTIIHNSIGENAVKTVKEVALNVATLETVMSESQEWNPNDLDATAHLGPFADACDDRNAERIKNTGVTLLEDLKKRLENVG